MNQGSVWARLVGVALIPVLLLGCGIWQLVSRHNRLEAEQRDHARYVALPVPEVVLGSSPAAPAKLSLPAYPAGDLATDGSSWPRACTLLTDDDIKAVLPQADEFERSGQASTLVFDTKEYHPDPYGRGLGTSTTIKTQSIAVPEASCKFRFFLPHKSLTGDHDRIATLTVAVAAAGDPTIVYGFAFGYYLTATDAERQFAKSHGGRGCAGLQHPPIRCTRGPLTVTVDGSIDALTGDDLRVRMPGQPTYADDTIERFNEAVPPLVMALLLAKVG
jgi:hypothetical protein